MKKTTIFFLVVLVNLLLIQSVSAVDGTQIYRVYNSENGEHLYTPDPNEAASLGTTKDWNDEGTGWYAPGGGTPIYRIYNSELRNHLYSTDVNEVETLCNQHGWVKDNNGAPIFYSGGNIPIYRLYNVDLGGLHHLTSDVNEYNTLPQYGWVQEGTAFYAQNLPLGNEPPAMGGADITNVDSKFSIQADVMVNGSGTGYHSKLVACSPISAVSYGLQFDHHAPPPYTGRTALLVENIASNDKGGQVYRRNGFGAADKFYRLLLAVQEDGTCDTYANGVYKGSVKNEKLAHYPLVLHVEGSARVNGDEVYSTFNNIKLKTDGVYNENKPFDTFNYDTNPGLHSNAQMFPSIHNITIGGRIEGLAEGQNWDNTYDRVSGIIQFEERK